MDTRGDIIIIIKYLVNLSEKAGCREEKAGFPKGSTLHDVALYLKENRNITLPSSSIFAVLNGSGWDQYPEKWSTALTEGDIVLLFPPISGG